MNEFADTESERIGIGKWLVDYASSKVALSDLDIHHAQGEVDGVAEGTISLSHKTKESLLALAWREIALLRRYDWRINKGNKMVY